MLDGPTDPIDLDTPGTAIRTRAGHGPAWDAAIAMGIDVTLLERNLRLSPAERLAQLQSQLDFQHVVQERTVRPDVLATLAARRLREKLDALGPELAEADD